MKKVKIRMLKIKNPVVRTMVGGLIFLSVIILGGGTVSYFVGKMICPWFPEFLEVFSLSPGFWGFLALGSYSCGVLSLIGFGFYGFVFHIIPLLGKDIYKASVATGNFLFNNSLPAQIQKAENMS